MTMGLKGRVCMDYPQCYSNAFPMFTKCGIDGLPGHQRAKLPLLTLTGHEVVKAMVQINVW